MKKAEIKPNARVRDLDLEERRSLHNERVGNFLMKLTRNDRRKVKKHMAEGMELKEALVAIGWSIEQQAKKDALNAESA